MSYIFFLARQELARNATGEVFFKPGAVVLQEGRQRRTPQWYVVVRGSALVSKKGWGVEDCLWKTYSTHNANIECIQQKC